MHCGCVLNISILFVLHRIFPFGSIVFATYVLSDWRFFLNLLAFSLFACVFLCIKALMWVLQPLASSTGSSISASACHSFKLPFCPAQILSLWVFPLRSLTNRNTSCFWPLSFTKQHLIPAAINTTSRFARQYKRLTEPSHAPKTVPADSTINQVFVS